MRGKEQVQLNGHGMGKLQSSIIMSKIVNKFFFLKETELRRFSESGELNIKQMRRQKCLLQIQIKDQGSYFMKLKA